MALLVRSCLLSSLVCASVALSGCNRAEIAYRVTITVNDHGTLRSNSGVWKYAVKGGILGGYSREVTAEAIPIDLGTRGTLYVTNVGRDTRTGWSTDAGSMMSYGSQLFGEAARASRNEPVKGLNPVEEIRELQGMVGRSASIDCTHLRQYVHCPFMVRFKNDQDPQSVEAVNPANLAATYGPDVSLEAIKIQLTNENPTVGILNKLPWISTNSDLSLAGEAIQSDFATKSMLKFSAFKSSGK